MITQKEIATGKKGFTLLELMVVVIVIGILAMVALPRFVRVVERAKSAEGRLLLDVIRLSQLRYYAEHDRYTGAITDLDLAYSPPKYFKDIVAGSSEASLGTARRIDSYTLSIDSNGLIKCADDANAVYKCKDAGF
ncbi:MAG: prepilin-type N-terminal cleavage/methylation domain-containing protein [Candidatus Omnitrophota bacterium]